MAKFTEAVIALNLKKPGNSSFFCPVNRIHLTIGDPVGVVRRVTPMIVTKLKGRYPSLINMDSRIDLETGDFKEIPEVKIEEPIAIEEKKKYVAPVIEPVVEQVELVEEQPIIETASEEVLEDSEEEVLESVEGEHKPYNKKRKKS